MPKLTKKEMSARGTKTMALAKKIYKEHPSIKWQQCVGKAAKQLAGKKSVTSKLVKKRKK